MTVYGIKNCNTVKTAIDWLKKHKVEFEFYDLKKGIMPDDLKEWSTQVGWETLVNKRGTTWRQLDEKLKTTITNEKSAISLMKDKTSVIKRPVLVRGGKVVVVGFDEVLYTKIFLKR